MEDNGSSRSGGLGVRASADGLARRIRSTEGARSVALERVRAELRSRRGAAARRVRGGALLLTPGTRAVLRGAGRRDRALERG